MDKDKKKTLTISSNLKKKIDTRSISTSGKKSFFVEKKNLIKLLKLINQIIRMFIQIKKIKKRILLENLSNSRQQKILSKKITNLLEKVS